MLYPKLFADLEAARWNMATDIDWSAFDASLLTDEQAKTIKMNAITEWSALPATEMFLRDNYNDTDFSAFMSVWFYEEQKHSLVLMEYLRRFRPELLPTEEELKAVRFEFDSAPALETLMLHFCGEMRLTQWYKSAAMWHTEPVIKQIYKTLSKDEARHGSAYLQYMRKAIATLGNKAKLAFVKIGILMVSSARLGKPMHPTNLHVSEKCFPNDTIQSRLPDPDWLEAWLDKQIGFNIDKEKMVIRTILNNLSNLCDTTLETIGDLSKFRKSLMATPSL
ncbi:MAG: ferritin-like domain-containing protein [Burkholderiales bacterium]|nr:ferritin-like domain-containing protein [Burkholderiales bacterium]